MAGYAARFLEQLPTAYNWEHVGVRKPRLLVLTTATLAVPVVGRNAPFVSFTVGTLTVALAGGACQGSII